MDEFIGKEIDAFCPINLFDLKVIPTFDIKRDRVCTLIHDVCVYLEVYTSSIHVSRTYVNIYVSMHTSRLDDMMMRVSRRDSHVLV